jgi:hypothetical protein
MRELIAAAGSAAIAVLALGLPLTSASAADLGGLDVLPGKGNAQTPMSVITERGCTEPAKRVSAIVTGKGFPADGQVVLAPSQILLSTTQPMELPLSNAFVVYAQRNNTALNGTYTITVRCTDRIGVTVLDTFSTTMTWRTAGRSVAKVDTATYVAKNTAGVVAAAQKAASEQKPVAATPGTSTDTIPGRASGATTAPPDTDATPAPVPLANGERADGSNPDAEKAATASEPAASASTSSTTTWLLLGLAVGALVAAALIFFRGRGSTTS